jgi:hypothetical protein
MKHHPVLTAATLLGATCFSVSASHAQAMKPGLWETTHKSMSGSDGINDKMAQMQQQMANLPPEQRKMLQDMMAKQGVTLGDTGPGGMSVKTCMTKEMIERNEVPQSQSGCTASASPRIGNTQRISFTCSKPPSTGEGQITFSGPEAYLMKMTVNTQMRGKSEKMDLEGAGKWLGADCGDVKPITGLKK